MERREQLSGLQAQEEVEMWSPPGGAVGTASSGKARICLGQEGQESEQVPAQSSAGLESGEERGHCDCVCYSLRYAFLFFHNLQVLTSILLDFGVLKLSAMWEMDFLGPARMSALSKGPLAAAL